MNKYILTCILAVFVGLIGGLQGHAGSMYILTGLLALGIVNSHSKAAGITLLVTSVPVTIGAAYGYYKKGDVDITIASILIPIVFLFGILGEKFNFILSEKTTEYSLAVTMGLCAFYFFYNAYKMK